MKIGFFYSCIMRPIHFFIPLTFLLFFSSKIFSQSLSKEALIQKVWEACGGKSTFEKSQFIEFQFEVVRENKSLALRNHLWDRYTGDYRFQYAINKDSLLTVLFNVNTKKGMSFINNFKVDVDSINSAYILDAYETFINDTYWLMVPLKLEDAGVQTVLQGDTIIQNQNVSILHLDFESGIGITDKDEYWLYINPKNGKIIAWKYDLQGRKGKPRTYMWSDYQDLGKGLKLPLIKTTSDGKTKIQFPKAKVYETINLDRFKKL